MLRFSDVRFSKSVSVRDSEVFLEEKGEVVFVGRSNVGKSSLMNALFKKKDLVKTSSTPGKTRLANQFLVDKKYIFTDLPGYGFAKLGKNLKEELDALISWYLEEKAIYIRKVVLVIDARLGPQKTDLAMFEYIQSLGLSLEIVLSKVDKLSKNEANKAKNHVQKAMFGQSITGISSLKNEGIKELSQKLKMALDETGKI